MASSHDGVDVTGQFKGLTGQSAQKALAANAAGKPGGGAPAPLDPPAQPAPSINTGRS